MSQTELEWDAFRYLSDEMSTDETAAFEQRLEHDQLARESLARCVELSQAVCELAGQLSPPVTAQPIGQAGRRQSRLAKWGVVSTVAACLLAAVSGLLSTGNQHAPFTNRSTLNAGLSDASKLVSIWAETIPLTKSTEISDEISTTQTTPVTELDVPDWLLAAVEVADQPESGSDAPEIREN